MPTLSTRYIGYPKKRPFDLISFPKFCGENGKNVRDFGGFSSGIDRDTHSDVLPLHLLSLCSAFIDSFFCEDSSKTEGGGGREGGSGEEKGEKEKGERRGREEGRGSLRVFYERVHGMMGAALSLAIREVILDVLKGDVCCV